jgi:hypothetical protein
MKDLLESVWYGLRNNVPYLSVFSWAFVASSIMFIWSITFFLITIISCEEKEPERPDYEYVTALMDQGLYELGLDVKYELKELNQYMVNRARKQNLVSKGYVYKLNDTYIVSIGVLSRKELLKTISHELMHIKQFDYGALHIGPDKSIMYFGKRYKRDSVPYFERPWEIDAEEESKALVKILSRLVPISGSYH